MTPKESEALRDLAARPYWWLDDLPATCDLTLLRQLDQLGFILFQPWHVTTEHGPQPSSVGWVAPIRQPMQAGDWDSVWERCRQRGEWHHPGQIRVNDAGKAELSRLVEVKSESRGPARPQRTVAAVRAELLSMRQRNEPYTSRDKLAKLCQCAKSTVQDAIKGSPELREWAATSERGTRDRAAATITPTIVDSAVAPVKRRVAGLTPEREEAVLAHLIDQASPEVRAKIHAMNDAERTALAEEAVSQGLDDEPSPLKPDPPGSRPLKVKVHKKV